MQQCLQFLIIIYLQSYQFRERLLPDDDDEEEKMKLATKLAKHNISVPQYVEAMMETDVPW